MKRLIFRVRIRGESMVPALLPGRTYWASGWLPIRAGDCIVFRSPQNPAEQWVKRVKEIRSEGYLVEGLTSWSTPSAAIGIVPHHCVLGRLLHPLRT